ncbi:uncharacterized protein LOC134335687 [Trichomycterus rosablanca]|uniref:uncharacterized protein LOC134335687 n=1 Tax=Trichomycterus rosablanca TaxID=2290929 RepID=UPI002F35DF7C
MLSFISSASSHQLHLISVISSASSHQLHLIFHLILLLQGLAQGPDSCNLATLGIEPDLAQILEVHFDCGAKVDVSDVKGLILSPGFPNNYSSGTHCVWQFFVPVGHQLTMEMFDFDVFRSPGRNPALSVDVHEEESSVEENPNGAPKERRFTQRTEEKQVVVQKDSGTMEPPENSVFISSSGDETTDLIPSTTSPEDHPENVCPDDVLYITDLIRFSLRFCGSERPSGGQLVFGSDVAMVEVVMELITSTHWGRGFALVFYYQNRTQEVAELGGRRSSGRSDGEVAALLAAVSIAALFGVAFVVVLCVILRSKMCTKGLNTASSVTSEVPVQNSEPSDGNELHLVAANRPDRGLDKNDNLTLSHTGSSVHHVCEISQNAQLDSSNGLLELELGTDEVFMISNVATPTVSSHMHSSPYRTLIPPLHMLKPS